jgi:hypothetical protein
VSQDFPVSGEQPVEPTPSPSIEELAPGVTLEWLFDRQMVVLTLQTAAREAIDATLERIKHIMETWPADRPYIAMQDLSYPKLNMTPYARERIKEPQQWCPELGGYIALVLPSTFVAQIVHLFLRTQKDDRREVRGFMSRDKALAWLQSKIGQQNQAEA